ncbi:helix-turn-helix domain-containing protein [Shewanella surugensis]|uniref:XRE family transcriptional regulator n=1 Tax=Shewanella surugensis TaxID=212020 RepID=A0ABT0L5T1_9GAMM|nr:XRE family transcriptional regulator [Shewanella surugensis]MCL1123043.1 XRE family transcriptional regulator [Shewanella surugensis]
MNNPNQHLARMLKYYRHQKSWSLDKTAQETGVSKAMLGQIERKESSPTVAILWKIATGMRLSLSQLLEPIDNGGDVQATIIHNQAPIFRHASALRSQPTTDNMLIAPLFPFDPQLKFEIFELTLLGGFEKRSQAHATGVIEHIIVISGSIDVFLGAQWQRVSVGEGVRFAADTYHGYRNLSDLPAVFHNIIYYP